MKKRTYANRLSLRIMVVLLVMFTAIMAIIYAITRDSMAREAESRYESIILHANEKIRGVLSDVYVGTINNINDIERDIDDPDKLEAHLERMVTQNMYMSSCRLIFERTSVTDTGRGIPEERYEHVFDTFREMGDNQKLQGLGLSICQAIVKLLGGKIWLDEKYVNGSRFIFELPKKQS